MPIGLVELSIRLHGVHSLKDKRSIVKPILRKLRDTYNCAAIESDMHDFHEMTVISVVTINTNTIELTKTMTNITKTVERMGAYDVTESNKEVIG